LRIFAAKVAVSLLTCLALLLVLPSAGETHTKSSSYSRWNLEQGAQGDLRTAAVQIRLPLLELTRFPNGHDWPKYLQEQLRLIAGNQSCTASRPVRQAQAPTGWAIFRWKVECPAAGPLTLRSDVLGDVLSSHLHFARVANPAGEIRERVLVAGTPEWALDTPAGQSEEQTLATTIPGYAVLGMEHILGGWDHVAFVLALLLLASSLREVATLVTAFTIAHSITLGLAVLGVYRPEPISIEVLIGFSIALVAIENSWLIGGRGKRIPRTMVGLLGLCAVTALAGTGQLNALTWIGLGIFSWCHFQLLEIHPRPARLRALVAFAFGLAHGFGFAGILMEIDLPAQRLLPALFGFNIGVELGQLLVVLLVWPLLRLLARTQEGIWYRWLAEIGSATIAGLGIYWVVLRNWG
jgi:hypothetical protein